MANNRLNFSTSRLADPTLGAQRALSNIGGIMDKRNARAQQDIANKRAAEELAIMQAQEGRAAWKHGDVISQEDALSKIYSGMPATQDTFKTVTSGGTAGTPGVAAHPGNLAAINAANAANRQRAAGLEALNTQVGEAVPVYEELRKKYFDEITAPKTMPMREGEYNVTPANRKQVVELAYPMIPGESRKTYRQAPDGTKMSAAEAFFKGYDTVDKFSDNAPEDRMIPDLGGVVPPDVAESRANAKALKDSGILGLNEKLSNFDMTDKPVPGLIKATKAVPAGKGTKGTSKQVKVTKELDNASKAAYLKAKIMEDPTLHGTTKQNALSKVDSIYPKDKAMTIKDQLALMKYKSDLLTDASTVADYRQTYPDMPKSISTVKGAKAYADSQEKALTRSSKKEDKKSFNLKSELYKGLTGKDLGDVEDLDAFLIKKWGTLKTLPISEQKTLVEKFKAAYNLESESDISDYLGGSAAGDVLDTYGTL